MNLTLLRRVAAICAMLVLVLSMTACYQQPGAIITEESTTTTEPEPTPTVPQKDGQLTLSLLMGMMNANMKWSQLEPYTHAVNGAQATFDVADNYGKECTLTVTFDAAADTLSEAVLSYGEASVSVLTDNTLVIRTIMVEMGKD